MSDELGTWPKLTVPKTEVREKLRERIKLGHELGTVPISDMQQLDDLLDQAEAWSITNLKLLRAWFDNTTFADEYRKNSTVIIFSRRSLKDMIEDFHQSLDYKISQLNEILQNLELVQEVTNFQTYKVSPTFPTDIRDVFVVHGHDEQTREIVASYIRELGLTAIILHEKANLGRTIIEKFEEETSPVGFAIILLTPDDIGASKNTPSDLKPRARQNVILELGYFIGKLGRHRVCPLLRGDIEQPSDIFGMVYVSMNNDWRAELRREMKAAGLPID